MQQDVGEEGKQVCESQALLTSNRRGVQVGGKELLATLPWWAGEAVPVAGRDPPLQHAAGRSHLHTASVTLSEAPLAPSIWQPPVPGFLHQHPQWLGSQGWVRHATMLQLSKRSASCQGPGREQVKGRAQGPASSWDA